MDLATPLIPDGVYRIRNVQSRLVVDLVDGKQDGRIAGAFDGHSNKHTKWRIMNEDDSSNRVSFQNMSTGTFASVDPSEETALRGSEVPTVWIVVKLKEGGFAIRSSEDANLAWILPHGQNRLDIILGNNNKNLKRQWVFQRLRD